MTCRDVAEFLLDYLEGGLPRDVVTAFERHLADCPACREYLRSYELTIRLGRAAFPRADDPMAGRVPDDLITAILASRIRATGPNSVGLAHRLPHA